MVGHTVISRSAGLSRQRPVTTASVMVPCRRSPVRRLTSPVELRCALQRCPAASGASAGGARWGNREGVYSSDDTDADGRHGAGSARRSAKRLDRCGEGAYGRCAEEDANSEEENASVHAPSRFLGDFRFTKRAPRAFFSRREIRVVTVLRVQREQRRRCVLATYCLLLGPGCTRLRFWAHRRHSHIV